MVGGAALGEERELGEELGELLARAVYSGFRGFNHIRLEHQWRKPRNEAPYI